MNRFYLRHADTQEIWGRSRAPPGPQTRGPPPGRGSRWEREVGGALPVHGAWRRLPPGLSPPGPARPADAYAGRVVTSSELVVDPCPAFRNGQDAITASCVRPFTHICGPLPPGQTSLPDARLVSVPLLRAELCSPKFLRGRPNPQNPRL